MEETRLPGQFVLKKMPGFAVWDVYGPGNLAVCQVEVMPSKGGVIDDPHDFANPGKAYKVTADGLPGVGYLEQIVKGEDLYAFLESVWWSKCEL